MNFGQNNAVQWLHFPSSVSLRDLTEGPTGHCNADGREISPSPPFKPPAYTISVGTDKTLQWDPPADSEELAFALSYHFPLPQTLEAKMKAATQKWLSHRRGRHGTNTSLNQTRAMTVDGMNVYGQITPLPDSEIRLPRLRHPKGSVSSIRPCNSRDHITSRSDLSSKSTFPQPSKCNLRQPSTEGLNGKQTAPDRPEIPGTISWKLETGEVTHPTTKKRPYPEDERIEVAKNRGNVCADHRRRKQKCDPMNCPQNKQRLKKDAASHLAPKSVQPLHMESNSPFYPFEDPEWVEGQDSNVPHTTDKSSEDLYSCTISPSTLLATPGESHFKAPFQNIPEAQATTGVKCTFPRDSAAASQTSISSSPPLSIFTPTNASSSDFQGRQSFSDSSVASLPVQEKHDLYGITSCNGEPPQTSEEGIKLYPANSGMHHVYHTSNRLTEEDNLHTNNKDSDSDPQIHPDVDFESFIHSEGFLYSDQSSINAFNFGITDDNCKPPVSINPRKPSCTPSIDPLTVDQGCMATSGSTSSKEAFENQKACDEDQMASVHPASLSSPARGGCAGVGGNNRVIRDCYAPTKPHFARKLSTRSRYSCSVGSPGTGRESADCVMRRDSTHSTASQDSRYSLLQRGPSTYRRESHFEGILRRDSTNSATSQDSQRNSHERGNRHGLQLDRSRKPDLSDVAGISSPYDGDSLPSRRGSYSDDVRIFPGRSQRIHAFSYDYKGRPLAMHRNTHSKDGHTGQDQAMEPLTSELGLIHI